MREREVKLSPAPGFRVPDLNGIADGVTAEPAEPLQQQASYFDTPDLRLARAGASLRYRDDEGWMVKLPVPRAREQGGDGLVRDEHRFEGAPGSPPTAAVELVLGMLRTASVQIVSRIRTLRRRVELTGSDGIRLAEVVDDEVSVLDGRHVAARFRQIEVEWFDESAGAVADAIVSTLRDAGAGDPDPIPKIGRALGPRALDPPDVLPAPDLGDAPNAGDVVRAALGASVARLIEHDPGVRVGDDTEAVHQARVATRRLRSDLRTFRELVDREWADSIRDELKWLGERLGAVRDADVLLERLGYEADLLPDEDRETARKLLGRLEDDRSDARAELLDAMRGRRYLVLLDRLVDAAREPVLVGASAEPAATVLPEVVRHPWERLSEAVDELGDDPPDDALHDVRKRAKRVRYAAEAAATAIGKPARRFAKAVTGVQDVLGEHQDAVVAEAWLRRALAQASPAETFVLGQLAAMERRRGEEARRAWPDAWREAGRKRLRAWL